MCLVQSTQLNNNKVIMSKYLCYTIMPFYTMYSHEYTITFNSNLQHIHFKGAYMESDPLYSSTLSRFHTQLKVQWKPTFFIMYKSTLMSWLVARVFFLQKQVHCFLSLFFRLISTVCYAEASFSIPTVVTSLWVLVSTRYTRTKLTPKLYTRITL